MYSLCSKPCTNYTQNPTLKRSKPYTKGGGKPYTERYMEAFKTLHETELQTLHCNGAQFTQERT